MSKENVEIVRQPIAVSAASRPRVHEQLFLRLPRVAAVLTRAALRFPPSSWLRQAMIRNALRISFEALNRGDYEAGFALVPPDYETITFPELVGLGFDPVYRGREGRLRYHRQWVAELGEFQNEPEEIIDLGDHVLLLGRVKGSGFSSGAAFGNEEVAYLFTISAGRIIREQDFSSHEQALEAAGLRE
jgi:ketosteroid isomerase-like protein